MAKKQEDKEIFSVENPEAVTGWGRRGKASRYDDAVSRLKSGEKVVGVPLNDSKPQSVRNSLTRAARDAGCEVEFSTNSDAVLVRLRVRHSMPSMATPENAAHND